ncbi:NTP transferase domain-containing protein [Patescibacteria group bacterium]|nr:NTP transferase domain-containing protein [Patescibacteria group bacterium]MBU4023501.1 NTP transferase domain-containing protein [Patescibacteria group bacterium]MBU4078309.1 NTP transferase domain-containing protein [Patescibacteria group bacterium]
MKPKAVILAAGRGTRLYPVTMEIPKPLLLVNKKPIINYLVELFNKHNVEEIIVSVLSEYRDDFFWWKKRYYPEKNIKLIPIEEPLGTWR